MNEERKPILIKEDREHIDKIKKKYKNLEMSDSTAKKIISLEIVNSILKTATVLAGIVTFIDVIIPDPVPLLDEAFLTSVTGLIGTASKLCQNKIDNLAKYGSADLKMNEAMELKNGIVNMTNSYNNAKKR